MPVSTTRPIEVFELMGAADDVGAAGLRERIQCWEAAISALRGGHPTEACALFEAIAAERPPGGLAAFYVTRSAEAARLPPEASWDGVDDFSQGLPHVQFMGIPNPIRQNSSRLSTRKTL
jgi:hypothetical protein